MMKVKSYDDAGNHDGWVLLNPSKILAISYEFDTACWNVVLGSRDGLVETALHTKREDVEKILAACGADLGPLAELEHRPEPSNGG